MIKLLTMTLCVVFISSLATAAGAQEFYDDDGVPAYQVPGNEGSAAQSPRADDAPRQRSSSQASPPLPTSQSLPPFDPTVMTYQFWLGSSAMLMTQYIGGVALLGLGLPLLDALVDLRVSEVVAGLMVLSLYYVPAGTAAALAVNATGNRYYPRQTRGAYLGAAIGTTLAFGTLVTTAIGVTDIGPFESDFLAHWGPLLSGATFLIAPAAGAVLGYQLQVRQDGRPRGERAWDLQVGAAPTLRRESGTTQVGLGLVGRF